MKTMTMMELLSRIRSLGISLWVDGDGLHYSAPKGALTQALRDEIAKCRAEIVAFLCEVDTVAASSWSDESELDPVQAYVAPRTVTEETLALIWTEVLDVERVGIHDNFFELGGDSLGATRVASRVYDAFQVKLSPYSLFEAPTVAGLSVKLEDVIGSVRYGEVPLVSVSREDELPLSFAQQRMWFLEQFDPGSCLYNIPTAHRLSGDLNVTALEESLNEIVRRHDTLRTTFQAREGRPFQVVAPTLGLSVPVVDLRGYPRAEREAMAQRLAAEETHKPFDLAEGPLLRATVLRLDEEEHVLLLTMHHIVSDGWSMGVFNRELAALYEAYSTGKPVPLTDLSVQYADFAAWQREWLQGEVLENQLAYWKEQLDGTPSLLGLRTDRPRPAVQTLRGAVQTVLFPSRLSESLKALSRKENCTLFITLLAAFKVLLYRYTGQEDIVVGTPIANRNRSEIEGLIGFFVNTLVLRTDLSGNPKFRELLGRVRGTALGAYVHQDMPFERLVEELQPERDASRTPLFQLMFVLQNTPGDTLDLPGVAVSRFRFDGRTTSEFDLILEMIDSPEGLKATLKYNSDLFDAITISRLAGHLRTLLEGVVADPDQRLSDLPLLTEAECRQLLVEWNDTGVEYPKEQCVHELFEAQVGRAPDAVAVVFGGERLTYQELNRRANQLAHYLRRLGVGPEVMVGICVKRSVEMVVGILGILKAGGAYLPLDPVYPRRRLAFMLEDAEVSVLVTQEGLLSWLPEHQVRVVCLDADGEAIAEESEENPDSGATTENLAYVIYTSGSTGRPKGVQVEHRGLLNLVFWHQDAFKVSGTDRATQVAGQSFDASVWELWPYLAVGASIHIVDDETRASPAEFRDWLASNGITISFLPTPLVERVLLLDWPDDLALRTLLTGGDRLTHYPMAALPFELVNNYGPTEDTVVTTSSVVPSQGQVEKAPPIGYPISNTQVYLLNRDLRPVPIGVPGELHVGGHGVARGYLNRPELTAASFIPNPFSDEPGKRLYRTGDLARYLPDGNIEFMGRIDHQVKVRGFRIELGEIEAVLGQHSAVRDVVVMDYEDVPGQKQLVAYVVPTEKRIPTVSDLRGFLKERLPDYMAPSAFVMLDAMPLNPSGKVDRQVLPPPHRSGLEETFVAPRNPIEEMLTQIWVDVLGVEQIGIADDFFALGGHSLKATQVVSRVRDVLGAALPLRAVFEAPTVAGLSVKLEDVIGSVRYGEVPLVSVSREDELPLSFAQQRMWFLEQFDPGSCLYNIPTAHRLSGDLNVTALEESLNEIVRRHDTLRTTFQAREGRPFQVVAPTLGLSVPVVDLRGYPRAEREAMAQRLAAEETHKPFDLAEGPLLRATVLRLDEEEHVLLLTMHHIVSDGWSMGVFNRELAALYEAYSTGKPVPLTDLSVQYADFAAWQREWLQGEVLENQLAYWKEQLDGTPSLLGLRTDRPRPAVQTLRGAVQTVLFPSRLSESLKALSRKENCTLFITLLAAFKVLLYRYTGQEDIVVGTPIANRNRSEIEGLIGFFVNTLVLRTDLSGNPKFRELLGRVRGTALGAYVHQDMPFERLVEELQPERDASRTPLFQLMFVLQNTPGDTLDLPGVAVSRFRFDGRTTSEFDLILEMIDSPEGLKATLKYNSDLFDAITISRLAGHLRTLLEGVVADPDQRLSDLPLLTEAECRQLLVEWNDTGVEYPKEQCVHELFEAQVGRAPDAVAVVFGGERLTYQELNRRANQLAHYLRRLGVGPEVMVGICVKRSVEMVVGILGILKAGGAYLPLDPVYPRRRLAFMLEDAEVSVLVTQEGLLSWLPEHQVRVVCLDADGEAIAEESEENPDSGATTENLAYVIYTSGSTGRPKGVAIVHRGTVALLDWAKRIYARDDLAGVLASTSISFDLSVFELFVPLSFGGKVILAEDVLQLPTLSMAERVTLVNTVPSAMTELLRIGGIPPSVRVVNLAGEPLPGALARRVRRQSNAQRVFDLYGPSEDTTYSTFALRSDDGPDTIGRPIARTQVYLLDSYLTPVPVGVPGELCLGGAGLARGYFNRPALTAERFVPDPFSGVPGARLYRTGDLARYWSDAHLEFLGRIDHQVKIRGFRIELEEIEQTLVECPAVREVAVLAHEDVSGDKRLVAYVVWAGRHGSDPEVADLRSFLRDKLPEYMVPSIFVSLEALPRTTSGKVDRRALPAPSDEKRRASTGAFVKPRTPTEEMLAQIWADVLGVEQIGVTDDFFALGGHSLKATQVVSRVRDVLGAPLPLRAVFEVPTVAGLSVKLEDIMSSGGKHHDPEVVPVSREAHRVRLSSLADESERPST